MVWHGSDPSTAPAYNCMHDIFVKRALTARHLRKGSKPEKKAEAKRSAPLNTHTYTLCFFFFLQYLSVSPYFPDHLPFNPCLLLLLLPRLL